jgi:hypothetical protein
VFALTTDENLALVSNETLYGLPPAAPVGQVFIHVTTRIVDGADLGAARLQVATVLTGPRA